MLVFNYFVDQNFCVISNVGFFFLLRVTPQDEDTSPSGAPGCSDGPTGASGGAMAISTLSLPMSQGKPSLRRIKGRIHRSKSLDSMDLLDSNVRPTDHMITPTCTLIDGQGEQAANNDYELVC